MSGEQVHHTTPDHYEVTVLLPDSTARQYLVIASSEEKAEAHIQGMFPEGRILTKKTLHRYERTQRFEVAP